MGGITDRKDGVMRLTFVPFEVSLTVLLTLLTTSPALADRTAAARNQGFQFYEAGRYQEAIGELDRVLHKHPRDLEALIKRGNCYLRLEQPVQALPDFDRVIRYSPLLPGAFTDRGIALLMLGRNDEALESFNRAVRGWKLASFMDPASIMDGLLPVPNTAGSLSGKKSLQIIQGHATAQSGLGQVYHRLGQDEQAVVEYNRAIEINPLDPNAYIGRGDCRVSLGDHEQALADYNEAIRLGPDHSRAYSSRGKLLEAMGQDAKAETDYDRAIQLDPSFTYALRLRAALLSRRGQNDRAIADVDSATRLRPDDASGYKDRGGVLVRLGQYQQAIDTLNRAIELDPNRAAAYLNRGAAYNGLRQYERAIEDLNKALALDPKNAGAHTNIGLAYYMIGQYERAIEDLSEAVRLAPQNAIVHLNRGNIYARLGFRERAFGDYETVTRLDPRLIAFYGGADRLLEDMGRNNLAIRDEKKLALQYDPAEIDLHVEQGNVLRSRGDWKAAIAEFDRAIERDPQRAEVYVARGWARLCAADAGAETDARSFLNIKGWRDRLSPYMALLGFLGSQRDDKENDARTFLDEAISSSADATWPVPVLHFLRHDISAGALLKAAANDTQKTEAHTFLSLELVQRGDLKKAREHLLWVREQGSSGSIATDLAKATLERLDHPQEALSRMIDEMLNR
jgi:tetratricopeptide (TPR) repeat protein